MKTAILLLILSAFVFPASAQNWTMSALSGTDQSTAFSLGRTLENGKSEVGLAGLGHDEPTEDYRTAFGPYFATEFEVPGLPDLISSKDMATFAGTALLYDFESEHSIASGFVGAILYPDRQVSPVAVYRYNWMDGSLQGSPYEEGSVGLLGLRIKF